MLKLDQVQAGYGSIEVLKGVSLQVPERSIVTLLGANGAGKTTTVRTITGLTPSSGGAIEFYGKRIEKLGPDRMIGLGLALVPQGRLLFPELSVDENLQLGAYSRSDAAEIRGDADKAYAMFPILKQKFKQDAGTLSGGQQQMLAIARALMGRPKLLMLDEPSLGQAPRIVQEIFDTIVRIREDGCAILLVEQNANMALAISDHGYVLESGRVSISGSAQELAGDARIQQAYLGHGD
jgi:branched-chain amino acid transport system ATP-binding protein